MCLYGNSCKYVKSTDFLSDSQTICNFSWANNNSSFTVKKIKTIVFYIRDYQRSFYHQPKFEWTKDNLERSKKDNTNTVCTWFWVELKNLQKYDLNSLNIFNLDKKFMTPFMVVLSWKWSTLMVHNQPIVEFHNQNCVY